MNCDKSSEAVEWIKPSRYNKGMAVTVEASDLLSEDEILSLISASCSRRNLPNLKLVHVAYLPILYKP